MGSAAGDVTDQSWEPFGPFADSLPGPNDSDKLHTHLDNQESFPVLELGP